MNLATQNRLTADRFAGFFEMNKWAIFAIMALLYVVELLLREKFILTDEVLYATYSSQLTDEKIFALMEEREQYGWLGYPLPAALMLVRVLFTTLCLNIGSIFSEYKISFRQLFGLALVCDAIFLIGTLLTTTLLMTVAQPETMLQVATFAPFSLLGLLKLFGLQSVEIYYLYPLQILNLFEVAYWFLLALGMQYYLRLKFSRAFRMVMSSYGIGLLIYLVAFVFVLVIMTMNQ